MKHLKIEVDSIVMFNQMVDSVVLTKVLQTSERVDSDGFVSSHDTGGRKLSFEAKWQEPEKPKEDAKITLEASLRDYFDSVTELPPDAVDCATKFILETCGQFSK